MTVFRTRLDKILTTVVWSCGGICFEQEDGGVMLQIMSVDYTFTFVTHLYSLVCTCTSSSSSLMGFHQLDPHSAIGCAAAQHYCPIMQSLNVTVNLNVSVTLQYRGCLLSSTMCLPSNSYCWVSRQSRMGLPLELLLHSHQPYLLHASHQLCCQKCQLLK